MVVFLIGFYFNTTPRHTISNVCLDGSKARAHNRADSIATTTLNASTKKNARKFHDEILEMEFGLDRGALPWALRTISVCWRLM